MIKQRIAVICADEKDFRWLKEHYDRSLHRDLHMVTEERHVRGQLFDGAVTTGKAEALNPHTPYLWNLCKIQIVKQRAAEA